MKPEFRASVDRFKAMDANAQARALGSIERQLAELNHLKSALRRAQKELKRTCPVPAAVDV